MTKLFDLRHRRAAAANQRAGAVLHLRLNRPAKRNAVNDGLILAIAHAPSSTCPRRARVVISGEGEHFCAGLDLSELAERDVARGRAALAHVARRASTRSSSAACRWSRCCTARWSAAGWSWPRLPHPRGRAQRLLRPARRPARHLRRRRRLGAHAAPDRRRAHDRHDAHRPRLRRRRRPAASACRNYLVGRRRRPGQGAWSWPQDRRQRAADQLRGDAGAAAHRRASRRPKACSPSR